MDEHTACVEVRKELKGRCVIIMSASVSLPPLCENTDATTVRSSWTKNNRLKKKGGMGGGGGSEWISKAYCLHESEPSSTSVINDYHADAKAGTHGKILWRFHTIGLQNNTTILLKTKVTLILAGFFRFFWLLRTINDTYFFLLAYTHRWPDWKIHSTFWNEMCFAETVKCQKNPYDPENGTRL